LLASVRISHHRNATTDRIALNLGRTPNADRLIGTHHRLSLEWPINSSNAMNFALVERRPTGR
jgi:hypothetical protein